MIRYLIHSIGKATASNKNFHGDVVEAFSGKGDETVGLYHYLNGGSCIVQRQFYPAHDAKEYGYSRLCDAKRNWSYNNPQNDEFWTTTVEIIAVEI